MNKTSYGGFPRRPGIVFMGTPAFAVPTLESLVRLGQEVMAVVTQPDRPKGRGRRVSPPPVKSCALEKGIKVLQPESVNSQEFLTGLIELAPDLLIVVAFGQILKEELLSIPRFGVLNIHASILPRHRGPAPIQWAILNNESQTGLTLMQMDQGLDTGPILIQKTIDIEENETAGHLHDRLALMGGALIGESLQLMAEGRVEKTDQDSESATYAPKITREMTQIDWTRPAQAVSALIRALDPYPGAVTTLEGRNLKLFSAGIDQNGATKGIHGRVTVSKESILVETGQGQVMIKEVQLAGKKRMPIKDFLQGFSLESGMVLGR
jgi:methionyl-tRNA formyltransferase